MGATQQSETTAVATTDEKGIRALLLHDPVRAKIEPLLPAGVSYDRVVSAAYYAGRHNPAILKCTPMSIIDAVARVQQWGLEIGITAHLVPFNTNVGTKAQPKWEQVCTPIADYKGLAELMVRSGAVRNVEARVVYEGDDFSYSYGLDAKLEHRPAGAERRGAITHAYAVLRLPFGRSAFEVMPLEDIDAIRKKNSKQWKDGPCPAWYAKKTVVRQIAKLVPKDPRFAQALQVFTQDEVQEFGEIPIPADDPAELTPGSPMAQLASGEAKPDIMSEDGRRRVEQQFVHRGDYAEEGMREATPEMRAAAIDAAASVGDPYDDEGKYHGDELPLGDARPSRRRDAIRDGGR